MRKLSASPYELDRTGAEDLLRKVYEMAQAMSNDWAGFKAVLKE